MEDSDRRRLGAVLDFAMEAHGDQTRRGVETPYASHLLQVAGLVMEAGGDFTQTAAGLLHDTLEDCDHVDAATLVDRFGPEVAALVEALSDLRPGDTAAHKSSWAERKTHYLRRLESADPRAHLVCACDKLHNLRSLVCDLRAFGPDTLERFNASPEEIRWYYESLHRVVRDALPDPLALDFDLALEALAEFVPRSRRPDEPAP